MNPRVPPRRTRKRNKRPVKKYGGFQVRLTASRTLSSGTFLLIPRNALYLVLLFSSSPFSAIYHSPALSPRLYTVRSPLPLEKRNRLIFTGRLNPSSNLYDLRSDPLMSCRLGNPCSHYGREIRRDVFQFTSLGVY